MKCCDSSRSYSGGVSMLEDRFREKFKDCLENDDTWGEYLSGLDSKDVIEWCKNEIKEAVERIENINEKILWAEKKLGYQQRLSSHYEGYGHQEFSSGRIAFDKAEKGVRIYNKKIQQLEQKKKEVLDRL